MTDILFQFGDAMLALICVETSIAVVVVLMAVDIRSYLLVLICCER